MNATFNFKEFTIEQGRCAMKVGTDGVLLGAWTSLENYPQTILDIGAGTGLIALMLAQRCDAFQIDALEIEENAYEQCVENFENSPWADRLFCYHASLDEFVDGMQDEKYDLIVSNPPYFPPLTPPKGEKSISETRGLARYYDSLPFEHLIVSVSKLLSGDGQFTVIIPFSEEENFLRLAENAGLFPNSVTRVRGTKNTPVKRSLIQFSFHKIPVVEKELIIEISRHKYTEEYKGLVKDFYLKM